MSSKDDPGAAAGSGLVSTAELAAALSVLPDPVFIMKAARDSHGTVVELEYEFLNEASARLLGRPVGPLVGIGLSEVFPTVRELGIFDRYVAVIDSASPVMFDVPWFQEGGVEGSFRLTASRFGDGLLVSASDITDVVRARQEAEAARAYLRATADSLLDPLVRFEAVRDEAGQIADFRFAAANSAACAYVGIPYEHLVGTRMLEHYPGVVSAGLLRQWAQVVETGEPLMLEDVTYPMETMGGQDRHLDVSAARVGDGLSFTWRDVTQQRQAFEAAQRLAAIVESSDDAIFRRNPDGIITSWNPGAERMFGYSSAEVVGTSTDLLIPEDRRAEVKPIMATIGTGRSVEHLETRPPVSARTVRRSRSRSASHQSATRTVRWSAPP